jgi:hypothetical protein
VERKSRAIRSRDEWVNKLAVAKQEVIKIEKFIADFDASIMIEDITIGSLTALREGFVAHAEPQAPN